VESGIWKTVSTGQLDWVFAKFKNVVLIAMKQDKMPMKGEQRRRN
jgi:hypothetical protein